MCGGLALAAVGLLRLLGSGFRSMPPVVALSAILLGAGVVSFGVVVRSADQAPANPEPEIALETAGPRSVAPRSKDVHGVVQRPDGSKVAGVPVQLQPLYSDESAKRRSTTTDDRGRFTFSGVGVTPGTPHIVDVRFDRATFSSQVLRFGKTARDPVRVVVAETTRSPAEIRLTTDSVAIVGDEKGVQVLHVLSLRNRSDRAFVGELQLSLLPGANAINPLAGLDRRRLDLVHGALISHGPILPGGLDVTYTYVAPMPGTGLRFSHRSSYPTDHFELLLSKNLKLTERAGLDDAGDIGVGGREPPGRVYQRFTTRKLDRGEELDLTVAAQGSSTRLRTGGLIAAGIAAVIIVLFPLVRRRRRSEAESEPSHQPITVE